MLARSTRRRRRNYRGKQPRPSAAAPAYPPEALVQPPGVVAQAVMAGFRCDLVDDAQLLEGPYHYNSGLVERPDGLFLAYRDQDRRRDPGRGSSRIAVCRLEGDLLEPRDNRVLELPEHWPESPLTEQREDPRLFWHAGSVWLSYVAYDRVGKCGQALVRLRDDWSVEGEVRVEYGGNFVGTKWQKNWCFFSDSGPGERGVAPPLRFVYAPDPHEVAEVLEDEVRLVARERGVAWRWGPARGGTPPVLCDGLWWSFFHSRLMCPPGRFRYFMGAYAFSPRAPYRPEVYTPEPILSASQHDPQRPELPLVVFPCGAVLRDGTWWVSLGVNDHSTAVARIGHDWLRKKVTAC